jgi:AcrR family transcriptional regulator
VRYQEGTPSRSDAKRNRKRILEVAVAELLECPDVPLRAIARKACVGQGTFYRNFPNRETLVLEIYRHEMGQLATSAAQLLEQLPPQEAIRRWMDELAEFVITRAGWRMRSA